MQLRIPKLALPLLAVPALLLFTMANSCNKTDQKLNDQENNSYETRVNTFQRAQDKYPLPKTENFPLRHTLVRFTEDQDKTGPVYVYVVSDVGTIMNYYVADSYPVNICAFLSSTSDRKGTLPSLDGIFYGGAGAASACDGYAFYDVDTGALVELIGQKITTANVPLKVDAARITVQIKSQ